MALGTQEWLRDQEWLEEHESSIPTRTQLRGHGTGRGDTGQCRPPSECPRSRSQPPGALSPCPRPHKGSVSCRKPGRVCSRGFAPSGRFRRGAAHCPQPLHESARPARGLQPAPAQPSAPRAAGRAWEKEGERWPCLSPAAPCPGSAAPEALPAPPAIVPASCPRGGAGKAAGGMRRTGTAPGALPRCCQVGAGAGQVPCGPIWKDKDRDRVCAIVSSLAPRPCGLGDGQGVLGLSSRSWR